MAKIKDSDGNWVSISDKMALVTPQGALCTLPHMQGGEAVPQSPIHLDNMVHTRSLYIESGGPITVEFWWTPKLDNPVNWSAIVDAFVNGTTVPPYDFSNLSDSDWSLLGRFNFSEGKYTPVSQEVVNFIRQHRWLKLVKTHGTTPLPNEATLAWRVQHMIAGT